MLDTHKSPSLPFPNSAIQQFSNSATLIFLEVGVNLGDRVGTIERARSSGIENCNVKL